MQLLRLQPAFQGFDVTYVTVQADYASEVPGAKFYAVPDATRWSRWPLLKMVAQMAMIVVWERPDVVVTTGAAPGAVALRIGKWLGARTVWIDSVANVEAMSMSGMKVRPFADLWLTQWEHLAREDGPSYHGAVL